MIPNCDITIYNKYVDATTHKDKYQRSEIKNVVWENTKAVSGLSAGKLSDNTVSMLIPFGSGENYVKPKAWLTLTTKTGKWTLKEGDVIVRDIVSDEIVETPTPFRISDLQAKYDDVVIVTSVDTMDQGSMSVRHWDVGAK